MVRSGTPFAWTFSRSDKVINTMNTLLVKGCWNVAKGKFRQKLARWTEDVVEFGEGKQDELVGRIQKRKALGTHGPKAGAVCCECHRPAP
jgi:uncharacterized protein YjbJ (UPF0337 family)